MVVPSIQGNRQQLRCMWLLPRSHTLKIMAQWGGSGHSAPPIEPGESRRASKNLNLKKRRARPALTQFLSKSLLGSLLIISNSKSSSYVRRERIMRSLRGANMVGLSIHEDEGINRRSRGCLTLAVTLSHKELAADREGQQPCLTTRYLYHSVALACHHCHC